MIFQSILTIASQQLTQLVMTWRLIPANNLQIKSQKFKPEFGIDSLAFTWRSKSHSDCLATPWYSQWPAWAGQLEVQVLYDRHWQRPVQRLRPAQLQAATDEPNLRVISNFRLQRCDFHCRREVHRQSRLRVLSPLWRIVPIQVAIVATSTLPVERFQVVQVAYCSRELVISESGRDRCAPGRWPEGTAKRSSCY